MREETVGDMADVVVRPLDIGKDDIRRVAWLLYITDSDIMPALFGKEHEALGFLEKLLHLDSSQFSHKNTFVATAEGVVVGILVGYTGSEKKRLDRECSRDYMKSMGMMRSLRLAMRILSLSRVFTSDVGDDEFYVNNLCVAPDKRSLGVGAALLGYVFERHDVVKLDVNINNDRGMKFYQRLGFQQVSRHAIQQGGRTMGAFWMRWSKDG